MNKLYDLSKYPKKLGKQVAIFQANHIVDVFFGDGWQAHVRFLKKRTPKGTFLSQVAGEKVPAAIFKQVLSEVL